MAEGKARCGTLTINIHADMAAYDALPFAVRRAIQRASPCYPAGEIADLVNQRGKDWVLGRMDAFEVDRRRIPH